MNELLSHILMILNLELHFSGQRNMYMFVYLSASLLRLLML